MAGGNAVTDIASEEVHLALFKTSTRNRRRSLAAVGPRNKADKNAGKASEVFSNFYAHAEDKEDGGYLSDKEKTSSPRGTVLKAFLEQVKNQVVVDAESQKQVLGKGTVLILKEDEYKDATILVTSPRVKGQQMVGLAGLDSDHEHLVRTFLQTKMLCQSAKEFYEDAEAKWFHKAGVPKAFAELACNFYHFLVKQGKTFMNLEKELQGLAQLKRKISIEVRNPECIFPPIEQKSRSQIILWINEKTLDLERFPKKFELTTSTRKDLRLEIEQMKKKLGILKVLSCPVEDAQIPYYRMSHHPTHHRFCLAEEQLQIF